MAKYKITQELKDSIRVFYDSIGIIKSLELLDKYDLTTEEINIILGTIGKFPAHLVHKLLNKFGTDTHGITENE